MRALFCRILILAALLFSTAALAQTNITSISAATGDIGSTVNIYGSGFTGATSVQFGGVAAASTTVVSDNQINAVVPSNFSYGRITIVFPAQTYYSGFNFSVANSTTIAIFPNETVLDSRLFVDPKSNMSYVWGQGGTISSVLPYLLQTSFDNHVPSSIDWTGRVVWPGMQNYTGYLGFGTSPSGQFYMRVDPNGILVSGARSVAVSAVTIQGVFANDEFEWRLTYEAAASSEYLVEYRINGVACQDCRVSPGTSAGPAISTMTQYAINTGSAALPVIASTPFYFSATPYTALPQNRGYEIVFLGDSYTAGANNTPTEQWKLQPSSIYKPSERWTRPGIYSFAHSGDSVSNQQARWDASPLKGTSSIKAVVILLGENDIKNLSSGPTVITALQGLVNDVHTANPTAKILLVQLLPVFSNSTTAQWTAIQAVNTAIANWTTNFTNVDFGVTAHYPILDDGTGNYKAWFGTTNYHPNNAGRDVISAAERAAIVMLGVLPP